MGGVHASLGRLSPNVDVGAELLREPRSSPTASTILTDVLATRAPDGFDASRPDAAGGRDRAAFWTGMVEYMQQGPDSLQGVLDDIEASWPAK